MNVSTTSIHYPVIVATPDDAKKYSEACQKIETTNKLKKKKTFERIKKIFGKFIKKSQSNEKIVLDDQYCFSITESDANEYYTESSVDDILYDVNMNYSQILTMSPELGNSIQETNIHPLSKKKSKLEFVRKLKPGHAKNKKEKNKSKKSIASSINEAAMSLSSPKMKEMSLYENSNINSPMLKNTPYSPSINSIQDLQITSPILKNNYPYKIYNNYKIAGKSNMHFIGSKDDLNLNTTKKTYASSIYSDDSFDNGDDDFFDEEIDPPSITDMSDKEKVENDKNEKTENNKNSNKNEKTLKSKGIPIVPVRRSASKMKKAWDNPFGRISFIEYTIEKQKEKEKLEGKNNNNIISQTNIVTKPPLKNPINNVNSTSKLDQSSILSKKMIPVDKQKQEEMNILPTNYSSNKKDSFLSSNSNATSNTNKRISEISLALSKNERDSFQTFQSKGSSVSNRKDKTNSVYSVTNLIKYSDFYADSNESSFSSNYTGSHYSQALNYYNIYKSMDRSIKSSINENSESTDNRNSKILSSNNDTTDDDAYDSNILNFAYPDDDGIKTDNTKEIKLSTKKSSNGINDKSANRKAIITEIAKEFSESNEDESGDQSINTNNKEVIECNRYLPCAPSASYILSNANLNKSSGLNIYDSTYNVLKHVNTLKAKNSYELKKKLAEAAEKKAKEKENKKEENKENKKEENKENKENNKNQEELEANIDNIEESEELKQPEDHYREYYEQEIVKPPEEESIDTLYDSENKSKIINKIKKIDSSLSNNKEMNTISESNKSKNENNLSENKDNINENSNIKDQASKNNEPSNDIEKAKEITNDESKKEVNNNNTNETISTKFFNFIKSIPASSILLYNEEKDKTIQNGNTNVNNDKEETKQTIKSTSIPTRKGSTKLVRSASLSLAKRHKKQINDSKNRNKNIPLINNNISKEINTTEGSNLHRTNTQLKSVKFADTVKGHNELDKKTNNNENNDNITITENINDTNEINKENDNNVEDNNNNNESKEENEIIENAEKDKEQDNEDKKLEEENLNKEDTNNEEKNENTTILEEEIIYSEPDEIKNEENLTEEVVNKSFQEEIIVENTKVEEEEDILKKIQEEMNKKFMDYDDINENSEILNDTFSISSCSTFSSAI